MLIITKEFRVRSARPRTSSKFHGRDLTRAPELRESPADATQAAAAASELCEAFAGSVGADSSLQRRDREVCLLPGLPSLR